jgi:hypothetical protein
VYDAVPRGCRRSRAPVASIYFRNTQILIQICFRLGCFQMANMKSIPDQKLRLSKHKHMLVSMCKWCRTCIVSQSRTSNTHGTACPGQIVGRHVRLRLVLGQPQLPHQKGAPRQGVPRAESKCDGSPMHRCLHGEPVQFQDHRLRPKQRHHGHGHQTMCCLR